MTSTGWTSADLPPQQGRIVVVTGANSGIGLPTARAFAEAGAHVVLAVRDIAKGEAAAESIPGDCEVRRLDLADLASVRAFAESWQGELSVLINNAGVMRTPERRTADGFELQIGTNHLGHFALTNLLLPHLTDRVVTVASGAHRGGSISLDDLNWQRRKYRPWSAYQQSKLANLLFTLELQRRLTIAGSTVRAIAAHPGYAATNLQFRSESRLQDRMMTIGNQLFAQTDEAGARPTLFAASQDLPGASYVGPGGLLEQRGSPALAGRTAAASDVEMAKRLWILSETLTGTEFPLEVMVAAGEPQDIPDERPVSLDRLEALVGEWEMEATFQAGFFGAGSPETTSRGRAKFQWLEGRFFLTQSFVNEHPDTPSGITIIGMSEERNTFAQHYYDSRGVARVYQMTLEGREWKLWREAPGFWQRYTGVISEDGTTITGAWEASGDGQQWKHDFDLTYLRTG